MANTNCLKGMRCPKCGYEDGFYIDVTRTVLMRDDGSELTPSDEDWDVHSTCSCEKCGHTGAVLIFQDA